MLEALADHTATQKEAPNIETNTLIRVSFNKVSMITTLAENRYLVTVTDHDGNELPARVNSMGISFFSSESRNKIMA